MGTLLRIGGAITRVQPGPCKGRDLAWPRRGQSRPEVLRWTGYGSTAACVTSRRRRRSAVRRYRRCTGVVDGARVPGAVRVPGDLLPDGSQAGLSRLRGLLEVAVLVAGRVLGRRGILGGLAGIVRAVDGVVVGEDHRHAAVALRAFLQLVAGQPGTAVLAGAAVVLRTVGR